MGVYRHQLEYGGPWPGSPGKAQPRVDWVTSIECIWVNGEVLKTSSYHEDLELGWGGLMVRAGQPYAPSTTLLPIYYGLEIHPILRKSDTLNFFQPVIKYTLKLLWERLATASSSSASVLSIFSFHSSQKSLYTMRYATILS